MNDLFYSTSQVLCNLDLSKQQVGNVYRPECLPRGREERSVSEKTAVTKQRCENTSTASAEPIGSICYPNSELRARLCDWLPRWPTELVDILMQYNPACLTGELVHIIPL